MKNNSLFSVEFAVPGRTHSGCPGLTRLFLPAFLAAAVALPASIAHGQNAAQGQEPSLEQQPLPIEEPTLHLTSRLVVVDVVVLDKKGHPVKDLDRSQFSVTENGVSQKIVAFDPPSDHRMPAGSDTHPIVNSTADLKKIGNAPVDILVLDEINNSFNDSTSARTQMVNFLEKQPEILPVPTQLILAGESNFQVLHDYTQNRDELLHIVQKHIPALPVQKLDSTDLLVETIGVLSQITESTRGTPGRKNILWVGSGYPAVNITNLAISSADILSSGVRRVTDRMLDARVSVTIIDPKGVIAVDDGGENAGTMSDIFGGIDNVTGPLTGSIDFGIFAKATGGQILANRNDVDAEIGHGADNSGVYYTLAYEPQTADEKPSAYRKIRVLLKDASLKAVARDGYFAETEPVEPPPAPAQKLSTTMKFDLLSAAKSRLPYNGITVAAAQTADGFTLTVERKDLTWDSSDGDVRRARLTVVAAFFNSRNKLISSKAMNLKQTVHAPAAAQISPEMKVALPLPLPPDAARARFVVRDAGTGVIGTADWEK